MLAESGPCTPPQPLVLDRPVSHVPDARVHRRVHGSALGLEPRPKHVERVDSRRSEGTGRRAQDGGGDVAWRRILLMDTVVSSLVSGEGLPSGARTCRCRGRSTETCRAARDPGLGMLRGCRRPPTSSWPSA